MDDNLFDSDDLLCAGIAVEVMFTENDAISHPAAMCQRKKQRENIMWWTIKDQMLQRLE